MSEQGPRPEIDAAYEHCRAIARREAKNFYYSFRVLPKAKSDAMCAVYAFMRRADDISDDESLNVDERRVTMQRWLAEWRGSRRSVGDVGEDLVFVALGDAQRRFAIPDQLLEDLVRGTTMDLDSLSEAADGRVDLGGGVQGYRTFADLYRYCYLVASVVGLVTIKIFGYSDPAAELLAEKTGVAFQLTNILRDVKEDAERKRIYLPQDLLAEFEVTNADVMELAAGRALKANERALLIGLSVQAWEYYEAAQALLPMVDADSRGALWVLVKIYSGLLKRIDEREGDVFTERASVPTASKVWTLARGGGDVTGGAALTYDAIVVGAGLAGLAAAHALAGDGAKVLLLERRTEVGGRAYSYEHPALGEVVDSQHVVLGCCTNLMDLCARARCAGDIRWYDELTFLEPNGNRSVMKPGWLSAPAHQTMSFLRAPMLGWADKAGIARGLAEFLRGYPADDPESFAAWVKRTGQTERAVRHFWEPVVWGALNDVFERCSVKYAGKVFHETFLRSSAGGRLGIPAKPLTEFFAPVLEDTRALGARVESKCGVDGVMPQPEGGWRVRAGEQEFAAKNVVLAMNFKETQRLLGEALPGGERFVSAPITTVHLWFDREVSDLDHAVLLDTRIQWMFHKSRIRGWGAARGSYLELVISASWGELEMGRGEILASALAEAEIFFPRIRDARLVKSGVLKEARATFSVTPGLDAVRPAQATEMPGMFLAGDWTRTEWPSTMEGAVRSGRLAAGAVVGEPRRFLSAEVEAEGLMRWLSRR